jgi:hypothetical protein
VRPKAKNGESLRNGKFGACIFGSVVNKKKVSTFLYAKICNME